MTLFLCTETPQELQQMLQELSDESRQMGLKHVYENEYENLKDKDDGCRQHLKK